MNKMTFEQFLKQVKKESNQIKTKSNNIQPFSNPISEYKIIQQSLERKQYSEPIEIDSEWKTNLNSWFGYVRIHMNDLISRQQSKPSFSVIQRYIESGEEPTPKIAGDSKNAEIGLAYFSKSQKQFSKTDLSWIFSFLSLIDPLLKPEMCENIQILLFNINKQLMECQEKNPHDDLIPYLVIISCLIQSYFHQSL